MLHYMILNDTNGSKDICEVLESLRPSLSIPCVQEGDNGEMSNHRNRKFLRYIMHLND